MDTVLRSAAVYVFLLIIFRIAGKRSLSQTSTFDFVLLLIVGEATQQALLGEDFSVTNAFLVIVTLVGLNVGISLLKRGSPKIDKLIDSVPLIIVENGRPLQDRLESARVDEADVLEAARLLQGLERMEQIKYAVLERGGAISVIPYEKDKN